MNISRIYKFAVIFSLVITSIPFWYIVGNNASFIADRVFYLSGVVFIFNAIASYFFQISRMWKVRLKFGKTIVFIYNGLLIILAYFPLSYIDCQNERFSLFFYLIAFAILPISLLRIKILSNNSNE